MYDIFSLKDFSMPEGFLWGSGYAGHQVEGNNTNTLYWKNEQEGKVPEKSGLACNSYEMFREDIQLVSDLGQQAFRTSIEWSRIQPDPDTFDEEATKHYIELFSGLKEKGIKTFCTLVHFTVPLWFTDIDGFKNLDNRKYFEKYLEYIVPKVAPYVDFWNVLNEFNVAMPPMQSLSYHALGYRIIKKYSKAPVSSAHAQFEFTPQRRYDKLDNIMCQYRDFTDVEYYLHAIRTGEVIYPFEDGWYDPDIKDSVDFWSVNLYTRMMQDSRKKNRRGHVWDHKYLGFTDMDYFFLREFYPEAITNGLLRISDKPIYISENGVAADNDEFRLVYLALHLSAINDAIKMGADVKGYLHWTLLDNYEWSSFKPHFGLVDVDRESGTFKRTPKPSAYFFKEIIENNGFSQEVLRKYLKSMPTLAQDLK